MKNDKESVICIEPEIPKRKWWQTSLLFGDDGKISESQLILVLVYLFDFVYLVLDLIGYKTFTWETITILVIVNILAHWNRQGSRAAWTKWLESINSLNVSSSGISLSRCTKPEEDIDNTDNNEIISRYDPDNR